MLQYPKFEFNIQSIKSITKRHHINFWLIKIFLWQKSHFQKCGYTMPQSVSFDQAFACFFAPREFNVNLDIKYNFYKRTDRCMKHKKCIPLSIHSILFEFSLNTIEKCRVWQMFCLTWKLMANLATVYSCQKLCTPWDPSNW